MSDKIIIILILLLSFFNQIYLSLLSKNFVFHFLNSLLYFQSIWSNQLKVLRSKFELKISIFQAKIFQKINFFNLKLKIHAIDCNYSKKTL